MTRFWKRTKDDPTERLLQAGRPQPRDGFANELLAQIPPATSRPRASFKRFAVATAATALAIGVAGVLGGVHSAIAGVGGLAHVAAQTVAPTKAQTASPAKPSHKGGGGKEHDGNKGKDDDDDRHDDDPDHHQYKVTICHWANHKYVTLTVSPQGAAEHKAHHPRDIVPAPPGGCPR